MSHHLDSPIALQDIRLDITDLYVFRGETGTVFVMDVCHSIFGKIPAPGYHPEGMYEFKIDLDGDAVEDLTYRFTFDARDAGGKQRFVLRRITGAAAVDPHAPGVVIALGSTEEAVVTAAGVRVWAGKAGDPFWIEPDVLHAVGHAFEDGAIVNLADGIRPRPRIISPANRYTPSFWKCPMRNCWRAPPMTGASACGQWRPLPPTRVGGVRSIVLDCR
jgi:hypothetical protein